MSRAERQCSVLARRQVLGAGLSDEWVARQLASGRWQRVHPGVYATCTGSLGWDSRCWAAVLYAGEGAALAGQSALRTWGLRTRSPDEGLVTVAVDHMRRVRPTRGVEIVRVKHLARLVHPARTPGLLRLESAVLMLAAQARRPDDAIGVLADACQQGRTTPRRLIDQLVTLPGNLRSRGTIRAVLHDVALGAYSFLEVHYLRDVERPHGLPTGSRQRRVSAGHRIWFRDVEYIGLGVVAELDGRLGHEGFDDRAADMARDNDTTTNGARTLRLGYRQVMSEACESAVLVAALLRRQGWPGAPKACSSGCPVAGIVGAGETHPADSGVKSSPAGLEGVRDQAQSWPSSRSSASSMVPS